MGDPVAAKSGLWAFLARVWIAIFGRWEPPAWLRFLGRKLVGVGSWGRAHRAASAILIVTLAGGSVAAWRINTWWKNRPKPMLTTMSLNGASGTTVDPEAISVYFNRSAAPISNVGKPIDKGVAIRPAIAGAWRWINDRQIVFEPTAPWAIGQKYQVTIEPKVLLAELVLVEETSRDFTTQPFSVTERDAKFYQDPTDESLKRVLVTYEFSHPVDRASFEKLVKMHFEPTTTDDKARDQEFEIAYDDRPIGDGKTRVDYFAYVKSKSLTLPPKNAIMRTTLMPGTKAKPGSAPFDKPIESQTRVPGLYNFMEISSVDSQAVDNEKLEVDLVLFISGNSRIAAAEMKKNLKVWQLPLFANDDEKKDKKAHQWSNEEVDVSQLKKGDLVALTTLPEKDDPSETHSFRYRADAGRYLYVEIAKGTKAFGGYVLGDTYNTIVRVPKPKARVKLLHQGSLLTLSGDRKLGAAVRDAPAVKYEISRILPDQVHHLFVTTHGSFESPEFTYPFSEADLSETFSETHKTVGGVGKNVFDSIDLGKYLGAAEGRRGLFLVKAQSYDEEHSRYLGEADRRLMLVTDLGLIVKDTADGEHQVFVQSLRTGEPVGGAVVQVLGRNGLIALHATTNGQGLANLPTFDESVDEKKPVLYLAQKGRDTTFLPIGRTERYLNLSRFDAGGAHVEPSRGGMNAFVFSDRGVYRPGEELSFGVLVRNDDWTKSLAGLPLIFELVDARGKLIAKKPIKASAAAFEEFKFMTEDTSPTGTYTFKVLLADNDTPIGSTTAVVREFLPDRMKINVALNTSSSDGWVKPNDLTAKVHLTNLFGTPATERKIKGLVTLNAGMPRLSKFRDFTFNDPLKAKGVAQEKLDGETDNEGNADFTIDTSRFDDASYRLSFSAEGFEKEGGRSVTGEVSTFVSPLEYLVGYRSVGDLSFVPKGADQEIELIAVGPSGKKISAKGLQLRVMETKFLSVLVKQPNDTYRYESFEHDVEIAKRALTIVPDGTKIKVPSTTSGSFVWKLVDDKGTELASIPFSVAGAAPGNRSMERNAELQINLKKKDVESGQPIEMQIKAPYVGAGLITIEREKVFAHKWFKTSTATSVQTINVPAGIDGDAYVSVTFLRDPASEQVFASPLSYGVVPFSISRDKRTAKITLDSDEKVKPGETVTIKVSADRPSRAIVFAIDEGILQVAKYKTPDPLKFFFARRALGVQTAQILDLVLPDFSRLLHAYAPGGGDDEGEAKEKDAALKNIGANLNPFKRKVKKPTTYWSGIIDVGPDVKELKYVVPDYFNGTLRIMAIAAAPDAIGATERDTLVRGDFVLSSNAPLMVAPGDEFEVPVTVANNLKGSGKKAEIEVSLAASKQFEIVGAAKQKATIAEMRESSLTWKLKATRAVGSGSLVFTASHDGKTGSTTTEISVRPAAPYLVTMKAAHLGGGDTNKVVVDRKLYPEFRELKAGVSYLPVGLGHGLAQYLDKFPHACTEQISSRAVPGIVLVSHPEFGLTNDAVAESLQNYYSALRGRQNANGSFGRWAKNPRVDVSATIYATQILLEAKDRGRQVPDDVLHAAMGYVQKIAADTIEDMADARQRAFAIYVLTRGGQVTTPLISKLQKQLDIKFPKTWRSDLVAAHLGAAMKLLKQDKLGEGLIEHVKLHDAKTEVDYDHYYDPLSRDAQVLYLLARHFPERLAAIDPADLESTLKPIYDGSFNTFSAAYATLALEQYGRSAGEMKADALSIAQVLASGPEPKTLALPVSMLPIVSFDDAAKEIVFSNKGKIGAYWQMNESGYDWDAAKTAVSQHLEVRRRIEGADGKELTQVKLGDEISVQILVRSPKVDVANLAIVDLLPGGFEVVMIEQAATDEDETTAGDAPPGDRDRDRGDDDYRGRDRDRGDDDGDGDGDAEKPAEQDEGDQAGGTYALPFAQDGSSFTPEYGDVREDRIVLYGSAGDSVQTFIYKMKATTVGKFQVPPVQAMSMYDRQVWARSAATTLQVVR